MVENANMDDKIRGFFFGKRQGRFGETNIGLRLIFLCALGVALLLRLQFLSFESGDWVYFLGPWTDQMKEQGFSAIAGSFYDYTPLYLYALYIMTRLPFDTLTLIKLFSVFFDYVLAFLVAASVTHYCKKEKRELIFMLAFTATLFLPTVFVNSGYWGQCESIYASFVVGCFVCLQRGKSIPAFLLYGIAFSLKLQSVFFLPVLLLLWAADKRIKLICFLEIPAVYFVSVIPAWIAGRPLGELLTIYFRQTGTYSSALSMNYPNAYLFIDIFKEVKMIGAAGVLLTLGLLLVLAILVLSKADTLMKNPELLLTSVLAILTTITFFLPYMHERYGYLAEIFAVIYAFTGKKRFYLPVLLNIPAVLSYMNYLMIDDVISARFLAVLNLVAYLVMIGLWYRALTQSGTSEPTTVTEEN